MAVSCNRCCDANLVKFRKFVLCLSKNGEQKYKNDKIPPQTVCFFLFLLFLCFELSCSSKLLIGGRESFENGRDFSRMWP